jgi:anti-sigma factor RsiW
MISEHPDDIILLDYVEGMLQGQASDSVRRHIATCRACRRTLAELSDTVSELERLPTAEIPHDALGRPGRAGMLRALARFVPVVLAATALVCAILFTRSGAGRKNEDQQATTSRGASSATALPVTITRESLRNNLIGHWSLPNVAVLQPAWADGYVVVVPNGKVEQARYALTRIAHRRTTPSGQPCTQPVAGQCIAVTVKGVPPATVGERADQVVGATS